MSVATLTQLENQLLSGCVQIPADSDLPNPSTSKRLDKAIDRSKIFLDEAGNSSLNSVAINILNVQCFLIVILSFSMSVFLGQSLVDSMRQRDTGPRLT